jgi:hypothetical protein
MPKHFYNINEKIRKLKKKLKKSVKLEKYEKQLEAITNRPISFHL